jgi:hypothetical protein
VVAGTGFSAISGSTIATTAMLGSLMLPVMLSRLVLALVDLYQTEASQTSETDLARFAIMTLSVRFDRAKQTGVGAGHCDRHRPTAASILIANSALGADAFFFSRV